MRASAGAAFALGFLAGCSSAPIAEVAPKGAVQIAELRPEPVVEPVAPEELTPRRLPSAAEDLRIPNERSCLLRAPKLDHAMLRLRPDAPAYAQANNVTDARVHVTADPVGTGLVVEVEQGPLSLAGITPSDELAVYAKRPITLGGIFLPTGNRALHITGAREGRMLLGVARAPYELRDLTMMLESDVPCEAASLVTTRIDARASLGRAIGSRYLVGDAVPLSRTVNGEPVASLMGGLPAAEILERSEGAARIAWQVEGGYVSGWVPAQYLGAAPAIGERGGGRIGGVHHTGRVRPSDRRICKDDVALAVELAEDVRFVGRIRAGAVIEIWGSSGVDAFSAVGIPSAEIQLLNGAGFLVRSSDIAECSQASAKLR